MKNDDSMRRLNSISKLSTIALALGEERTRSELIPFLTESNDDEDEILLATAEELGNFVPYVGGPGEAHVLIPPLENLSQVEETVVRDKAVESLCKVGEQMPDTSIADAYAPLIKVRRQGAGGAGRASGQAASQPMQAGALTAGNAAAVAAGSLAAGLLRVSHVSLPVADITAASPCVCPPAALGTGRVVHCAGVGVRALCGGIPACLATAAG